MCLGLSAGVFWPCHDVGLHLWSDSEGLESKDREDSEHEVEVDFGVSSNSDAGSSSVVFEVRVESFDGGSGFVPLLFGGI